MVSTRIWGFPKVRGTFFWSPQIRSIVFWGLYWGPLILGNYYIGWGNTGVYIKAVYLAPISLSPEIRVFGLELRVNLHPVTQATARTPPYPPRNPKKNELIGLAGIVRTGRGRGWVNLLFQQPWI